MIRHVAVFILGLSSAFAQQKGDNRTTADKAESTVTSVPAGAAEISPGLFKHTDRAGKAWLYRKTPFGIVKSADDPAVATKDSDPAPARRGNPFGDSKTSAASGAPSVTAVEDGDSYKFERQTPFGPTRWTRKKSELTADEQEIVERLRKPKAATTGSKE